jgi:hypothetical protein
MSKICTIARKTYAFNGLVKTCFLTILGYSRRFCAKNIPKHPIFEKHIFIVVNSAARF